MNDKQKIQDIKNQNIQSKTDLIPAIQNNSFAKSDKTNQSKNKNKWFLETKNILKSIGVAIVLVIIFYAGYQFAVYQSERNNNFSLPHFNFHSASELVCNPCFNNNTVGQNETEPYNCINQDKSQDLLCNIVDKPVIYLYPTHVEKVQVKLSYAPGFSKTIPTYNQSSGWQVVAHPDGIIINQADGKAYPYLYWEGNPDPSVHFDMTKGFVVSGSKTKDFLSNQLVLMGLNQTETNAFIDYWLPKMENNPFNLIHFAGNEYTDAAKLSIYPEPQSLLRVFMAFRPLQKPINVYPQTFPTFQRQGFVAVEWGGTELKN